MSRSPFTFNTGYADNREIAMFSTGRLPKRDSHVDPRLPTKGTGEYEWKGYISADEHPQQVNPGSGLIVNWNNRPAPGWGAADDNWSYGSTQRVRMLEAGIAKRGVHDLASVTSAMNAAATQDLRDQPWREDMRAGGIYTIERAPNEHAVVLILIRPTRFPREGSSEPRAVPPPNSRPPR